jgi:hypothetical protein
MKAVHVKVRHRCTPATAAGRESALAIGGLSARGCEGALCFLTQHTRRCGTSDAHRHRRVARIEARRSGPRTVGTWSDPPPARRLLRMVFLDHVKLTATGCN